MIYNHILYKEEIIHQRLKTNAARWLFCFALTLGLMMVVSGPAMAATTKVNTWDQLKAAVLQNGTVINVTLENNLDIPAEANPLYILSGKSIKLNLNHKTLNRLPRTGASNDSAVINVSSGGRLEITGSGIITGGRGRTGGGIYVNGGTVVMQSGTIENNYASQKGGGVYIDNGGTFSLNENASIKSNNTDGDGAGVYVSNGIFNFGGTVEGNIAKGNGGGVYVGTNGSFYLDSSSLTSNTAAQGGGIYAETNIELYGSSIINNNSTGDIHLNNAKIKTGSSFNPSQAVSVTLASGTGDITTGANYANDNAARAVFTSENTDYEVYANDNGQAALRTPAAPTDPEESETYTIKLTGGANATHSDLGDGNKGDITLTVARGERMQEVKYVANSNSHFTQFNEFTKNGVTVKWQSGKTITVTGTPTANVEITIPDAVADSTDPTPGGDETPISATVTFKVVNGAWNTGETTDKSFTLSGTSANPPKLTLAQIPSVGGSPNEGYKAGS